MTDKERLKEISNLLERYYSTDDSFEQTDLAIEIIQGHVDWLINRVEELETQLSINTNNMKHLQNKIERYKQALGFYADEKNHEREWDTFADSGVEKSEVMKDGGEKARQALEGEKHD